MTSTFATNFVDSGLQQKHFLQTNKEGVPLQGQVPLTYQRYSGAGNETIAYDGSAVLVIDSTLATGALTVNFSAMNNWLGRKMTFIVTRQLLHDVIMDFGTGNLYVPPLTSPLHTNTFPKEISPAVGQLVFFTIDSAAVLTQTAVFPQRIIGGGPGQVLTTNAGTGVVDWEDPQSGTPKCLTFKWSTGDNDLNQNTPNQVQWSIDAGRNTTSLTLGNGAGPGLCGQFTVTRDTVYSVTAKSFIVSDPSIAYRYFIGINNEILSFGESTLGLTGQDCTSSLQMHLSVGDVIAFYIGNAAGTVTPVAPADANYGTISIVEF